MRGKRRGRGKHLHGHKVLALQHDARLVFDLPLHHVAEHALPRIVVMSQGLVQAVPHLAGNHRRRNKLGVRMLQAGAGIGPVILENRNVVHPPVGAQRVIAILVNPRILATCASGNNAIQPEWSGTSMMTS